MKIDLTPTEELMMDVLAARHRLGETLWTFSSRLTPAAKKLGARGLAHWKSGVVEKTIQVWLTEEGKKAWLSPTFDTEVSKASSDSLSLSPEEASAVEDAMSYYVTASSDNFGAGYYGEEDREVLMQHRLARDTLERVTDYLEARDRAVKPPVAHELHEDLFPEYEPCYSRGPRIGGEDERPLCLEPNTPEHLHRGYPGSGFDSQTWGNPPYRDADLVREWRWRQDQRRQELMSKLPRVNLPADPEPKYGAGSAIPTDVPYVDSQAEYEANPDPVEWSRCYVLTPHPPHAWDTEKRTYLRYHCKGVE